MAGRIGLGFDSSTRSRSVGGTKRPVGFTGAAPDARTSEAAGFAFGGGGGAGAAGGSGTFAAAAGGASGGASPVSGFAATGSAATGWAGLGRRLFDRLWRTLAFEPQPAHTRPGPRRGRRRRLHFRDWFRWCRFRCLGLVYRASGLVGVGVCLFGRERLGGLLGGLGGFHEPRWTEPRLGSFRIGLGLLRGAGLLIGCALWRGTEEFPARKVDLTLSRHPLCELTRHNLFDRAGRALDLDAVLTLKELDHLWTGQPEDFRDFVDPYSGQR